MLTVRLLTRRFAWLMLGAAIGLAVVLVVAVATGAAGSGGLPLEWPVAVGSVLAGAALGLVPGVRELEVTAARTMLDAGPDLLVPGRPRPAHRIRTSGWVLFHLVSGLAVAVALFALIPGAVVAIVEAVTGERVVPAFSIPSSGAGQAAQVVAAVAVIAAALLLFWPLGALAGRLAVRFLGPTPQDRLEVARERADREAEHIRLARELHDGIGHALTIVSVQAAAGRRVQERDPAAAAAALGVIEDTAREALEELDALLAVLREDRTRQVPATDLADLVAARRRVGMELDAELDVPAELPPLLRRNLHRIVAEALANADRHGWPGPVRLVVGHTADAVTVEVTNPRGRARTSGGGRGLAGVRERVALFGGSMQAGPDGEQWVLTATLPRPTGGV